MAYIHFLPDELLVQLWDHLDVLKGPPPSVKRFDAEPSYTFTKDSSTPLKDLSVVCKRWRQILLPELFAYSRIALSPTRRWIGLSPHLLQRCERYVVGSCQASEKDIDLVHRMRRRFWSGPGRSARTDVSTMEYVDSSRLFLEVGHDLLQWIPSVHGEVNDYLKFIQRENLDATVYSFVLTCDKSFEDDGIAYNHALRECAALWIAVFTVISPLRVVIAAHPTVMALLTESRTGGRFEDQWLFKQDMHYLELSRSDRGERQVSVPCQIALHNIRSWTHLSYNEGSSIPAYGQYEYWQYRAPAVLNILLLWVSKEQDHVGSTQLQSVKYTACFPQAGHVREVFDTMAQINSITSIETRWSPDPDGDQLDDARMGRSDRNDCWREWNQCYHNVLKYMESVTRSKRNVSVKVSDYSNTALVEDLDKMLMPSNWVKEEDTWRRSR